PGAGRERARAAVPVFVILDFGFWIGPAKSKAPDLSRPLLFSRDGTPSSAIQNPKSKIANEEDYKCRIRIRGGWLLRIWGRRWWRCARARWRITAAGGRRRRW